MKAKAAVLLGLLVASVSGCGIRCLSTTGGPQSKSQNTGSDDKVNVHLVDYQGTDAGTNR